MALKVLPPIERLSQLIVCDVKAGTLIWKARTPDMFPLDSRRPADAACASWNTRFAGKPALASPDRNGYGAGTIDGFKTSAHRVCMAFALGKSDFGNIDHINGDKTDNRAANLRLCAQSDNMKNLVTPRNNTSGTMGIRWDRSRGKWFAYIRANGKMLNLGRFSEKVDAVKARKDAEVRYGYHENHGRIA